MEETLDTVDDDEIEEEADAEVDKVLFELTDGKLGQAGKVGGELPVSYAVLASRLELTLGRQGGRGGRGGDAEDGAGDAGSPEQLGWRSPRCRTLSRTGCRIIDRIRSAQRRRGMRAGGRAPACHCTLVPADNAATMSLCIARSSEYAVCSTAHHVVTLVSAPCWPEERLVDVDTLVPQLRLGL